VSLNLENFSLNQIIFLLILVVKNLPKDLESTRITSSSSDESLKVRKPESERKITPIKSSKKNIMSSTKKVPETPKTPRYLDICDSDTASDDSLSDDDFNPNETWNASSDENVDEEDRIKKRSIARKSRKDEEIVFVADESPKEEDRRKKLNDLLDRLEYKKPIGIDSPKPKPSKRKLFTHSHYDEDFNETPEDDKKENEANVENVPEMIPFPFPTPINKKIQDVKDSAKKFEPKKTPKAKVEKLKVMNNFAPYSFLKSLDVESNQSLCHPEALSYRNNYKSKKTELTEKLFKLYDEKVFDNQLKDVPIKWNKKLLNTAGRCNNSRKGGVRLSQLELSEKVLTSADRLRCTLIHEMCHAATWILQGENGHGATWKRWAAKANSTFPELPKINVCHDYIIEYRYTYQCVSCKAKYQAHSKNKKVENIRCSICKSAIELFLNKKNKDGEVVMTPVSKEVKGFPKFVKMNYKEVKMPNMTHKEVMQVLSSQFSALSVEQKQNL
jgi:predicted SprT family Zn-dependent metalloprotease